MAVAVTGRSVTATLTVTVTGESADWASGDVDPADLKSVSALFAGPGAKWRIFARRARQISPQLAAAGSRSSSPDDERRRNPIIWTEASSTPGDVLIELRHRIGQSNGLGQPRPIVDVCPQPDLLLLRDQNQKQAVRVTLHGDHVVSCQ